MKLKMTDKQYNESLSILKSTRRNPDNPPAPEQGNQRAKKPDPKVTVTIRLHPKVSAGIKALAGSGSQAAIIDAALEAHLDLNLPEWREN